DVRPPRLIHVREVVRVMPAGSTRPLYVETDEGPFVLRLAEGADGPRALAAEWVATRLAERIGLPTLQLRALDVEPRAAAKIAAAEIREHAQRGAGICLGSRVLPGARVARNEEIEAADDDFALRVLWLDMLVENPDRRAANPNILALGASL